MSTPRIRLERTGDIARITLDRPEVGNAIDLELARELLDAAIACDHDKAVRCVVLTGAGRFFCVGGDIGLFRSAGERLPQVLSELTGTLHLAVSRLARMAKPLLVLVNGPAAGAGMSLALLGDVVLASSGASFASAYGALGLSPDGALTWLLPRLVGLRRAQELVLTARRVDAAAAKALGLVTDTVEAAELETAGQAMAERLAAASAPAIGAARNLLLQSLASTLESHMESESRAISALGAGPEAIEGVRAFLDKRAADFRSAAAGSALKTHSRPDDPTLPD
jgi:2-(1,2-epoxy-1,2-dihydrophenyl)acetyl-CoA isomerase